jgi:hypothetical protein
MTPYLPVDKLEKNNSILLAKSREKPSEKARSKTGHIGIEDDRPFAKSLASIKTSGRLMKPQKQL